MTPVGYHGADGRSHRYPWLEVGQEHRDAIEEITLTRVDALRLQLDFGKPLPKIPAVRRHERLDHFAGDP